MEKIWLKSYQPGVPEEINPDAYPSIIHLFEDSCEKYRHNPAARNFGVDISYDELDQMSMHFAAYCQNVLRLPKGARVAIMMPNVLQYLIVMFGAMRAGLTIVNVNPLYTPDELVYQLNDADAQAIIVLANFAHTVEKALPKTQCKHVIVTEIADCFPKLKRWLVNFVIRHIKKMIPPFNLPNAISLNECLERGKTEKFTHVELTGNDIAYLQYTGGTTGVAKGAVLTHRNMIANVEQAYAWVGDMLENGKEVIITALPLYHIFSLTANSLTFLKLGALNVLITNPRDLPSFIKELKNTNFTAITGVNTLFNAMMNQPGFDDIDFSHLKITMGGGMAVQNDVARRWQEKTGCIIVQAYGLTEASPAVTINPFHMDEFNGSIGLPIPSTEVSIRDDNGIEVPLGEPGELCVRGPQVMREYWNKADETENVFYEGGWLRTGDVATIDDDGFVRIIDRIKDMIVVSGFKVYPNEVEDVIANHPAVVEVGVVATLDDNEQELVTAFVVRNDESVKADDIISFCRNHLTAYKVPKRVEFLPELPKTNVGKILRRALRDHAK